MSRAVFNILSLGIVLLALPGAAARADDDPWTPFGPGGGSVLSLAVDPGDPQRVYAAAGVLDGEAALAYGSADGGQSWKALAGPRLNLVAVDPERPATLYAAGVRVLRSTNRGETWTDITPRREGPASESLTLVAAPGGVLFTSDFAGSGSRLLRSADRGDSWTVVARADTDEIVPVVVDPTDPRRVYYTNEGTVYRSLDGGQSWAPLSQPAGASFPPVRALAVAPSAPATLYAVMFEGERAFRSDDAGATWRELARPPRNGPVTPSLRIDPRSPDRLLLAGWGGLFASADGGQTWTPANAGLPRSAQGPLPILALAAAPGQPDTLYAGTLDWGVARSASAGSPRWRIGVEPGLNAGYVALLEFDPRRPETVYVNYDRGEPGGGRSFRSADGGRSWQPFAREIAQQHLVGLAFDPVDPKVLYAATFGGIWRSADDGGIWRLFQPAATLLAVTPRRTLLANVGDALARSADGGRTWKSVISSTINGGDDAFGVRKLWVDPLGRDVAYAYGVATDQGTHFSFVVFRGQRDGTQWRRLRQIEPLSAFAAAPGDFRVLYAVSGGRLLRSNDAGASWTVVNPGPIATDAFSPSLAVDGADPDQLYIGTRRGVLFSRDGGRTLTLVDAPFEAEKRDVRSLWTGRNRPGRVYATAFEGGLFEGLFK